MSTESLSQKLILGTVQFGLDYGINNNAGKMDEETIASVLTFANTQGLHYLDTADAYGSSQESIGKFHRQHPQIKFKILTKFKGISSEKLLEHTKKTLELLDINQFECISLHDFKELSSISDYDKIKNESLTKKIGVSVYTPEEGLEALKYKNIDIIQIPFNVLDNENRWQLFFESKNNLPRKVEIHSRSAFLQGLFYKSTEQIQKETPYLKDLIPAFKTAGLSAAQNGKTLAEFSLSYCLQHKNIDKVLVGVDSHEQLQNNLRALGPSLAATAFESIKDIHIARPELINPSKWPRLKDDSL